MDIFNYDSITKEYLSTEVADLDPIDQLPMIPAHATDVVLPTIPNGSVAVFNGTDWTITVDNRGTVYDINTKQEQLYEALGDLPANLTTLVPTEFDTWDGTQWILDLALLKIEKKREITEAFETDIKSGFITNLITMDSDINDILKFTAGVRLAEALLQSNIDIRDYNNSTNTVTVAIANSMLEELGINYSTLLNKKWSLLDAIDLETNINNLNLIVW